MAEATHELEFRMIAHALIESDGNAAEAARLIGVPLTTFWRKVRKLNLAPGMFKPGVREYLDPATVSTKLGYGTWFLGMVPESDLMDQCHYTISAVVPETPEEADPADVYGNMMAGLDPDDVRAAEEARILEMGPLTCENLKTRVDDDRREPPPKRKRGKKT